MHILYMCVYIYYKELAYTIMEADKSQDVHSASWRPRKANGIYTSGLKVGRLETHEEPLFLFESKGRKKSASKFKDTQAGNIPS